MKNKKVKTGSSLKVKAKRIKGTHHISVIMYEYIIPNVLQNGK